MAKKRRLSKKQKARINLIKTAGFILLLLVLFAFLSMNFLVPKQKEQQVINANVVQNATEKVPTGELYMDLRDKNTNEIYKASMMADARPMLKAFMGCFYNNSIDKDYSNGRYTLIYYDIYGTFAKNFTFKNLAAAERAAADQGICIYGENYEFMKKQ